MATNDRVTQPNTIGQHKKTEPLSQEAVAYIDTWIAKLLLAKILLEIPQFTELWRETRSVAEALIKVIKPRLENILAGLSPEARGALVMGEKAYSLYEGDAVNEAKVAAIKLDLLFRLVNEVLEKQRITMPSYQSRLEAIIKPLGVPDLVEVIVLLDMKEWGIDQILAGPIAGPTRDLLESVFIRETTDLSPVEVVSETQASIIRRVKRKVSPLSRHIKRYALEQRIQLWVRNVVYGESIHSISAVLEEEDEERPAYREPGEWVKTQIREASKILGVRRRSGRPRKGGVLRQWELMAK